MILYYDGESEPKASWCGY